MIDTAKSIIEGLGIDLDRTITDAHYRGKKYMEYFERIGMAKVQRKFGIHIVIWIREKIHSNYGNQDNAFAEVVMMFNANPLLDSFLKQ